MNDDATFSFPRQPSLKIITKRSDGDVARLQGSFEYASPRSGGGRHAKGPPLFLRSSKVWLALAFFLCFYMMWMTTYFNDGTAGIDMFQSSTDASWEGESASALIIYDYQGLDEEEPDNLRFFLAVGIDPADGNHYLIVSPGKRKGELVMPYPLPKMGILPPNVHVVWRPARTCKSKWGVMGWALESGAVNPASYQAIILMDSTVRGPFLPSHWPPLIPWSAALVSRLRGSVHMVGTTIVTEPTMPGPSAPSHAVPRPQPRVSSVIALDHAALDALKGDPETLQCHGKMGDAKYYNEAGASAAVLREGYNLDCLMVRYKGRDWRDRSKWGWKETKSDLDSDPFQVMFIPLKSNLLESNREAVAAHQLSKWALGTRPTYTTAAASTAAASDDDGVDLEYEDDSATEKAAASLQMEVFAALAAASAHQLHHKENVELKKSSISSDNAVVAAAEDAIKEGGARRRNDDAAYVDNPGVLKT